MIGVTCALACAKKDVQQHTDFETRIFTRSFTVVSLINLFIFLGWQVLLTGLPLYTAAIGGDALYAGLMTSVGAIASVIARPFSGLAVDALGRKRILIPSLLAMIALTFGYLAFPLGAAGVLIRFLHGAAWGFASTANSTLPVDIVPRKRIAESMGYFALANSLAMAFAPAVAIQLAEQGHQSAIIYASAIFTVVTFGLSLYYFLSGYKEPPLKPVLCLREAVALDRLFNRGAVFPSVVIGLLSMGFGALATFIGLMCQERGIEGATLYFIVYAAVSLVMRPLIGRVTDRHGYFLCGLGSCLWFGVSLFVVAFTHSIVGLVIAGGMVGVGLGTALSAFQSMSVALAEKSSRGAATATYLLFFNLGISLGGLIGSLLISVFGYTGMFVGMGCISFFAAAVFAGGGRERIESYSLNPARA